MMAHVATREQAHPVLQRLGALVPLDAEAHDALYGALSHSYRQRARSELVAEGAPITGPRLIVSGWAARVRLLADGRRQFLSFLLPGDLIGLCRQPEPLAVSTVLALTEVTLCPAPPPGASRQLDQVYALSQALDEGYLLEHIARLGRLNAYERIVSLLLELQERLSLSGIGSEDGFEMPLTQEILADALGLTPVHVNRTLQQARRAGDLDWRRGRVLLRDPAVLADAIGRSPMRVSAIG